MTCSSELLSSEKFWQILKYLSSFKGKCEFNQIQEELGINQSELLLYISFMKDVGLQFDIINENDNKILEMNSPEVKIEVKFSLLEWLSFQSTFPKISELNGEKFFAPIKNKLLGLEEQNKNHDLFSALEVLESKREIKPISIANNASPQREIVNFIEEAIIDKKVIKVNLENNIQFKIYPRKVVFLDGQLSIVAEGIEDRCILNLSFNQIISVYEEDQDWIPVFSVFEIDDFLVSLRAITENEIRLVLKVYSSEKFNTNVKHHHFANQCMFTNPEGDHIWAATIEPNEEILSWLSELGTEVEVLDPLSIKKDLLKYCENKLKKIA